MVADLQSTFSVNFFLLLVKKILPDFKTFLQTFFFNSKAIAFTNTTTSNLFSRDAAFMDRNDVTSNTKEELTYIGKALAKILFITLIISAVVGFILCNTSNTAECIVKTFSFSFGSLLFLIGLFMSCYYSSFSLGFDAIWTPQLQGEIQRDERKRQISGWASAITGGLALLIGIITLYFYINLYVL